MESSLVNARVPNAKREIGAGILESLGATTSELINGAYDYLIEYRRLPGKAAQSDARSPEAFARFAEESTCAIEWGADAGDVDYREILRSGKRAEYESLD